MKTIAQLEGADFLRQCNKIRKEAWFLMQETEVLKIRKRMPELDGTETTAEKKEKLREQSIKNLNEMLDCLLDKHAEETERLLKLLIVLDEGESVNGIDLAMAGLEVLSNKKVVDFLSSMARLGQSNMAG